MEKTAFVLFCCLAIFVLASCFAPSTAASGSCTDRAGERSCKRVKRYCESHNTRMEKLCKKTCNYCNGVCIDILKAACRRWAWHGACKTYPATMKKFCRRSCGFCAASAPPKKPSCASSRFGCCWDKVSKALGPLGIGCKPCVDKYKFCRRFYVDCILGHNKPFMETNCPVTCRKCVPRKGKWSKSLARIKG